MNNDIEVIEANWLTAMAEHVQRPEVGAVGPRLLYPDDTVQHAGVVVGVGGIAEHAFRGLPAEAAGRLPPTANDAQLQRRHRRVFVDPARCF